MKHPNRRRAAGRRLVAAFVVVAGGGLVVTPSAARPGGDPAPPTPARSARSLAAAAADQPVLRLVGQPSSVGPDDPFAVEVSVAGAPAGSDLAVDIYDPLTDPTDLEALDDASPRDVFPDTIPVPAPGTDGAAPTAGFAIELYHRGSPRPPTTWAYRLDEPGVYPVRVRLRSEGDQRLATLYTTLIRRPSPDDPPVAQARVAVLATVHQDLPRRAEARRGLAPTSGALRRGLARTAMALAGHPTLPVAFAVTPETGARLAADDRAAADLAALRTELERPGRLLLDAPYVDVDPTVLAASGLGDELVRQRDLGRRTLERLFRSPRGGAWALQDPVDRRALGALAGHGIGQVLLPARAFADGTPRTAVDLPTDSGSTVRALAVDPTLAIPAEDDPDPVLAAHRLLARLTLVAESGTDPATEVVALDATRADATALGVVTDALTLGTPALRATPLATLLDEPLPSRTAPPLAEPRVRPLRAYAERSALTHADVASYASMVGDRPALLRRFDRPLAITAARELAAPARLVDLAAVDDVLQSRFRAVHTPPSDKVTLGARDARFPITIESSLPYPVAVLVEVEANDRLSFPRSQIPVTLDGPRTVVSIRVRTRASGDTPVQVTVRSADGRVALSSTRYTIRSTAVSGVGLVITIGAAGFLALWWARHWWRARRDAV